jgi:hypothetical protein
MAVNFNNVHEMLLMARRNLSQDNWDYINGAAETETTLRRNRMAIDSLAFRPRVCRDVRAIDTSTTFLGEKIRIPVLLAPMGSIHRWTPNGASDVDTAAEEFGTINFISTVTEPSLEEIAANSPHPKSFQIYVRGDDDWIKALAKRAVDAGYKSITLTVDSSFYGNRERLSPTQMALRNVPERDFQKGITWDTVKMVQDTIGDVPFVVKGIMTAEDAAIAVEPIRAAPTVFRGRVFAVTIANELHALNDSDGKTLWTHIGITEAAGLLGGAAPAAAGSVVVSSFSSGEVFALRIENGRVIWSDSLTAIRRSSPLSTLAHIRGRPVIDRGQVIVTANSGRTVAINLRTGARVWEKRVGAGNGPWVAGEFIYVLSAFGELICLSRRTGGVRWVTQLQRYEDEEDQEDPVFWTGPILAGDRLLIGGSHEEVWSISPYTGRILGRVKVSGPVFIPPVVANDTVYILSDDAKLVALR